MKRVTSIETSERETLGLFKGFEDRTVDGNGGKKSLELKEPDLSGLAHEKVVYQLRRKKTSKEINTSSGEKNGTTCYCCGITDHLCGKQGHLKRVCTSKRSNDAKCVEISDEADRNVDSLGFLSIKEHGNKAITLSLWNVGKLQ